MTNVTELFGSMVFDDTVMKERLPNEIYLALQRTIHDGAPLDRAAADTVANAMKDWAIEKGATHYTHWFQPMTGITAEKHDSFIAASKEGRAIMEFRGKELIKGESDASSFPSGGLRATFEARGYTAWDPTSYAFIKDDSLYIPTAFCSYTGEVLDKKTPLLRSMEALNIQAKRILRLFGNDDVKRVITTVGGEQEYFLIDKSLFDKRKDLIYTGRTLFGAQPPKGQEMEDHYYGVIKPRVSAFMKELDEELWKLGIYSKTKHNEAAPAQHEMAPIFTTTNIAADHNQLIMEMMKKVAERHGLVCLLHEKPFKSINGSGKHNNWSILTDTGVNLLDPGKTPSENAQFLLFFIAVIKAVDEYQGVLRASVASAGNDHRLGANEAPPAIVSVFVGDELQTILSAIENGVDYHSERGAKMQLGVDMLPYIRRDNTDRNRTSPFAFTGTKFEFRMPGSSAALADPNTVLNTAVAEALRQFADELTEADDFTHAMNALVKRTYAEHKRIIFNGNGYSDEWKIEAEKRGLLNLCSTVDALPQYVTESSIDLFTRHNVLSEAEIRSRCEILLETYSKVINIEALAMIDMALKEYYPTVSGYAATLARNMELKQRVSGVKCASERELVQKLSALSDAIYDAANKLKADRERVADISDCYESARGYRDIVFSDMVALRSKVDEAETMTAQTDWPVPNLGDIIFRE